ncbi:serine/alanine adding enzyme [Bacilli bacterium PM5-3]|nr:serine/alanine adding enzyme [Bacilli bacterium PM5-3]
MELILNVNEKEFNDFVLKNNPTNIMQTSYWAKVKDVDWKPHYLVFKENGNIVASALLLERKAFLSYSMFYCSRGFILDYSNEDILASVIKLSKDYVKKNRGFVLRFDPEIALYKKDCRTMEVIENNEVTFEMLSKHAKSTGLNKDMDSTFQPRFQMVVNLKDGELKEKVKSKKRRLVNDTYLETRGYQIIDNTCVEGVKEFARLSKLTEEKQGVALRNEEYFMKMYNAFKDDNYIKIYMAQVNVDKLIEYNKTLKDNDNEIARLEEIKQEMGNIINTNAIICIYGTNMVQMFYGASDDKFSKYKAGYKLHYQAMDDAKENGYDYFNLGGVSGTLDDGLTRFKSEYHPELFEYVGDFDIVNNGFVYSLFMKGLPLLKKIKRKLKK